MSHRILIVDDNLVNQKLAATTLRYAGYEVLTASDAESARALLESGAEVHLVLMDLALPGMDGLTLTRLLKADARTADIRIVILTASAMQGDEQIALRSGADGYITKPIRVGTFPDLIAAHLRKL